MPVLKHLYDFNYVRYEFFLAELRNTFAYIFHQVPNDVNIQSCGNQIHSSTVNDVSEKALDTLPEDYVENATEKLLVSVINDINVSTLF